MDKTELATLGLYGVLRPIDTDRFKQMSTTSSSLRLRNLLGALQSTLPVNASPSPGVL